MIPKEPKLFILGLVFFICAAGNSAESGTASAPVG
jgi:hypothetical protein